MIERPSFQTRCPQGRRDPYLAGLVPALDRRPPARRWNQKVYKKDLEGTARLAIQRRAPWGSHCAGRTPVGNGTSTASSGKRRSPNTTQTPGLGPWAVLGGQRFKRSRGPLALRLWTQSLFAKPPENFYFIFFIIILS